MRLLLGLIYPTILVSTLLPLTLFGGSTPQTITMDGSTDNATAFGADGTLGTDNSSTFYVHWDATYLYVGWDGGRTNYSSDMYYIAIDVVDGQGSSSAIDGVNFDSSAPDFYALFENNSSFHGAPVSNGNAFEIWQSDGFNGWTFLSRTSGNDNTSSKIIFSDGPGEVRFRIAWATLGVSPGADQPLGLTFWNNNADGDFAWATWPSDNPTGNTTQTMSHKVKFDDTADGTTPSTDGYTVTTVTLLPVELVNFQAKELLNKVQLDWKTASELNNDYFTIERSEDGKSFMPIGHVKGAGTTKEPRSYSWADSDVGNGMHYYRLKQTDYDGSSSYSDVEVVFLSSINNSRIWPNPAKSFIRAELDLASDQDVTFELLDLSGKIHHKKTVSGIAGTNNHTVELPELKSGMYILRAHVNGVHVLIHKVQIQ